MLEEYNQAFTHALKNSFTKSLKKLDGKRDDLLLAIRATLYATVSQRVLNVKRADAAQEILTLFTTMTSNVRNSSYSEESAQINAFIAAVLSLPEESLTNSGIKTLFTTLQETESAFDSEYSKRNSSDEKSEKVRRMSSIRKDTIDRLDALFSYINMNGRDLPEEFGATVESLNSLSGETMSKAM